MSEASKQLKFELAQDYKNKIITLENYYHKSLITNPLQSQNIDVFAIYSDSKKAYVSYIKVIKGIITFTQTLNIDKKLEETDQDIILAAILYLRDKHKSSSKEIISNINLENQIENTKTVVPQIGDKKKLLEIAMKNAILAKKDNINKNSTFNKKENQTLIALQNDLDLKDIPKHIECFDNSNTQGTNPVASMVCFKDGKPYKNQYRLFNIKSVDGPNDFASMQEVVYRRYNQLKKDNLPLPNLIIIDGGKGQLNSAIASLKELKIYDKVEIISIAKKLEEIYKPKDPFPVHLNKVSPSLRLILKIRDESHRFALQFHKKKRDIKSINSKLINIKGFGPKTVELLLKKYKSINNIEQVDKRQIINLLGEKKANLLFNFFETEKN